MEETIVNEIKGKFDGNSIEKAIELIGNDKELVSMMVGYFFALNDMDCSDNCES